MRNSSRHDLRSLVDKVEAEHHVLAQECEVRWCDDLDKQRRALALELSRVLERLRCAT